MWFLASREVWVSLPKQWRDRGLSGSCGPGDGASMALSSSIMGRGCHTAETPLGV